MGTAEECRANIEELQSSVGRGLSPSQGKTSRLQGSQLADTQRGSGAWVGQAWQHARHRARG